MGFIQKFGMSAVVLVSTALTKTFTDVQYSKYPVYYNKKYNRFGGVVIKINRCHFKIQVHDEFLTSTCTSFVMFYVSKWIGMASQGRK